MAQTLMMIGGGNRSQLLLEKFVQTLPSPHHKLLILPWGTEEPKAMCEQMYSEFIKAGAMNVQCLSAEEINPAKALLQASAIYFPGGDQNKIMTHLLHHQLKPIIRKMYLNNQLNIGGTSAGSAIQSELMITGDFTSLANGLGVFPKCLIDQHFLKRNRQQRLLRHLKKIKTCGIGIDEGTAVFYQSQKILVLGESQTWYYPNSESKPIKLNSGSTYPLTLK